MKTEAMKFGPRRGVYVDASNELKAGKPPLSVEELVQFEMFDEIYRSLCALMYNYVPMSGHPGGSISSGRFVAGILYSTMDYDVSDPDREDADLISYAAGHKALGLYGSWALRNEVIRIAAPGLLSNDIKKQLRLEDLLGFRQNPIRKTPLFKAFNAKPLDGHPTPATPFVRLSTGASGVGVASSIGLAFAAADYWGKSAPRVHVVEGEGGMTPGRVGEALAAAGTASLGNLVLHVDWNQASIDSNRVCRDGSQPGEYVQWDPMEFAYLYDWNVVYVPNGLDFQEILTAQKLALEIDNGQPTAVVYRTTKGWKYGIQGRASHGAGHKLCTEGLYLAAEPLLELTHSTLPRCEIEAQRCAGGNEPVNLEACYWDALKVVRKALEQNPAATAMLGRRLENARERLNHLNRRPRENGPQIEAVYETAKSAQSQPNMDPPLKGGSVTTLRGELGRVLSYYNKKSGGVFVVASADLLGSTSVNVVAEGFGEGYWNAKTNPASRVLSIGGICEDAMAGIFSGMASYGHHIGVASSYGAFLASLGHIAARLHAIGNQARRAIAPDPYKPFFLVCAHAGLLTGEDGPTHADPQPLQLLQDNFPRGTAITLTPWEPQEIWTLVAAALAKRPAVITPFVTRPNENVLDRGALGLAPASAASTGVYRLRAAKGKGDGSVVLQESAVTYAFVEHALPLLDKKGIDLNVYYVASAELFDLLPKKEQEKIFPDRVAQEAMGITGFTLPTMYRWIRSEKGQEATMHPFQKGHFLGSGQGARVLEEAGLDGESQYNVIVKFLG
jgi:transketolase